MQKQIQKKKQTQKTNAKLKWHKYKKHTKPKKQFQGVNAANSLNKTEAYLATRGTQSEKSLAF